MRRLPVLLLLLVLAAPALAQPGVTLNPDTVQARPLDGGKMWLFEDPPVEYLRETYGFQPDAAWFERARLGALRMPGCSASFVSPHGLVATNHHCAQGSVIASDRGGEGLLDAGFYARTLAEERPVADMYMDQLVAIADVTAEVSAAVDAAATDADRRAALEAAQAAVVARLLAARGITNPAEENANYVVQVVGLYNGGRYSAYTFRRYRDVRLVMAPEARLGYFGGDYDNFTYPRYAADFAFFRVYDDARPLRTEYYFPLSTEGVQEGSLVFVVGNPGSTSRGLTVAELAYLRDVQLPATLSFINTRAAVLQAYLRSGDAPNPDAIRGALFGLMNTQKATGGRLRGLQDPYIIARRAAAERAFRSASADAAALIDEQVAVQAEKRERAAATRAFGFLFNPRYGSALLRRAQAVASGSPDAAAGIATGAAPVERGYLVAELEAMQGYYLASGAEMPKVLQSDAATAADFLLANSLAASAETAGRATADDPAVGLVAGLLPEIASWRQGMQRIQQREAELSRRLGRARFATYGSDVPPDATFSLRFTDGVVTGYPHNGTQAPPVTTLFGLFDRHFSYCETGETEVTAPGCDWELPQRWLDARPTLDLATPVNFTSTSDTIGGNSGSPVVNQRLELVGLNFDRTIEGLVRDYLYAPERGRNVMVDARFIIESLTNVYKMDGLVTELTQGALRQ